MRASPDRLLGCYQPSECRAILVHKYFLGIERGYDPPLPEVLESWEHHHAMRWRTEKMRRDARIQIREIENHRRHLSHQQGAPVDFRTAARDWVDNHEERWRADWERSADACP